MRKVLKERSKAVYLLHRNQNLISKSCAPPSIEKQTIDDHAVQYLKQLADSFMRLTIVTHLENMQDCAADDRVQDHELVMSNHSARRNSARSAHRTTRAPAAFFLAASSLRAVMQSNSHCCAKFFAILAKRPSAGCHSRCDALAAVPSVQDAIRGATGDGALLR